MPACSITGFKTSTTVAYTIVVPFVADKQHVSNRYAGSVT